ncbi:Hrd1 ubiquitin ligase complex (derlin) Der1/Dfm1 [Schizosaccharomyces osmophilus]|uniref:Derlin n=1 Tax=Schizosaccharomyces osmophilus TaxID=2545709 RepID=A0AAE9WCQ0_9SCHI|nr:Hrd1 ubiquitin ligase complex (derlin) Der1/Dfm1 [Schizosaccharomyces osmophilus]WBW73987.1 Hrd1 ubiquitin ligase complex (derlin) Der1/Dfm1 [Schizosaccharomyces osmophilus]
MASEFTNQVQQLLERIPPVTRYGMYTMSTITVLYLCQLLSPHTYVLDFDSVFKKREVYRLISNFFFIGSGLSFIFNLFFFYQHGSFLESHVHQRNTKSYLYYLLKIVLVIDVFSLFSGIGSALFSSLSCAMAYTWSLYNAHQKVQVFFLFQLPGKYLPYSLLGMSFLMGGPAALIESGFGLLAGFLVSKLDSHQPFTGFSSFAPSSTVKKSSAAFKGRGQRLGS